MPPSRAGSAASVSQTSNEFGFAVGLAIYGTIATVVYQSRVTGPAEAREGIAGAMNAAARLSPHAADGLLESARAAFTAATHVTAAIGAALFTVLAFLSARMLRPGSGEVPTGTADSAVEQDS